MSPLLLLLYPSRAQKLGRIPEGADGTHYDCVAEHGQH